MLAWPLGKGLLQFDADTFSLACAAEALALYYTDMVPPPITIYICSPSSSALMVVRNLQSTSASAAALMFHQSLTMLTLCHPDLLYILVWTPQDEELEGQQKAWEWALEASRLDLPDRSNCVQSVAFQKARACEMDFLKWMLEWYFQCTRNTLNINVGGGPLNGHAHTFAITDPPNGHNHPLWTCTVDCHRNKQGQKIFTKPLYMCCTTSTTLQLAVDHAFTGSYAK